MTRRSRKTRTQWEIIAPLAGTLVLGCAAGSPIGDGASGELGKGDASAEAVFLHFTFSGEVVTDYAYNPESVIEDQLLFTIGHLNGERSVGRLDKVELSSIETEREGSMTRIRYRAVLPVAWTRAVPDEYTFELPIDMSYSGARTFAETYGHSCVEAGAHDVDSGSMWYYYRPNRSTCALDAGDVKSFRAEISPSGTETTGKFPEYHKVWEDDQLRVVAIFGKNEAGMTSGDPGISAFNSFVQKSLDLLAVYGTSTLPADVSRSPGAEQPDVEITATLPGGRSIQINALLVDGITVAGSAFYARYESLTPTADFIAYAGHSGLGANIRALAQRGRWMTGQYALVLMNGCDTYAYVDSSLADAHVAVNPDDTTGTRYLDIMTNAMPAMFLSNASNIIAITRALLEYDEPRTFEQIFADIDSAQVVLVSGEEDNVFVPGYDGSGGGNHAWAGMSESGEVLADQEQYYATERLAAGDYVFAIDGDGDADLYVRIGDRPTTYLYDCRPYRYGSVEECIVTVASDAEVHVVVRGWDPRSSFTLTGSRQ